jgi:hypothetical protein
MVDDGGADLMFWFRLERGGDDMKYYRKIKQMQRACLDSIGSKRDTVRWHGDVGRRRGGTEEKKETTSAGLTRNLLG